ncbi:MAG: hypothetical protein D6726_12525, partial [Nitrospirae bacterium]
MYNCSVCGKELQEGDRAYGTTMGWIDPLFDGFISDPDSPWLTVACEKCGERISEAIANLTSEDSSKEVHIFVSGGIAYLRKAPP